MHLDIQNQSYIELVTALYFITILIFYIVVSIIEHKSRRIYYLKRRKKFVYASFIVTSVPVIISCFVKEMITPFFTYQITMFAISLVINYILIFGVTIVKFKDYEIKDDVTSHINLLSESVYVSGQVSTEIRTFSKLLLKLSKKEIDTLRKYSIECFNIYWMEYIASYVKKNKVKLEILDFEKNKAGKYINEKQLLDIVRTDVLWYNKNNYNKLLNNIRNQTYTKISNEMYVIPLLTNHYNSVLIVRPNRELHDIEITYFFVTYFMLNQMIISNNS